MSRSHGRCSLVSQSAEPLRQGTWLFFVLCPVFFLCVATELSRDDERKRGGGKHTKTIIAVTHHHEPHNIASALRIEDGCRAFCLCFNFCFRISTLSAEHPRPQSTSSLAGWRAAAAVVWTCSCEAARGLRAAEPIFVFTFLGAYETAYRHIKRTTHSSSVQNRSRRTLSKY